MSDFTGFSHDCSTGKNTDIKRNKSESKIFYEKPEAAEPTKKEWNRTESKIENKEQLIEPEPNLKQISEQEKQELREKYKEELIKADAAEKKATLFYKNYAAIKSSNHRKTFASNGKMMMSGYTGEKNEPPPPECSRVEPEEMFPHCKKIGHQLTPHMGDNGVSGRFNACHAEKQLSMRTTEPIGVSRPMCKNCKNYFQKQSKYQGKALIVKDPQATRIFFPDETFVEL